jgi:hypothetical protein
MSLKTTIILSETQSTSVEQVSNGMSGYRLDLSVDTAVNIDPKIFILHREVLSLGVLGDGDDPYEDTFYSVASVPMMESVPEAPTTDIPFYRVSSVSLVFSNLEDLNAGRESILGLVEILQEANDGVINVLPSTKLAFPPQSLSRFWGYTAETTITDEILLAGFSDTLYQVPLSVTITSIPAARYFYFAMPASLGSIQAMNINGTAAAQASVSRSVQTVNGCSVPYIIYKTQSTIDVRTALLEIFAPS